MSQKETVLSVMKDAAKPLRSGEIAELAGLDKTEVDRAMKELKAEALIYSPKRCFWQASE
jgi:predicted transcriptional regulator